jgi:signal transduction histidine kinase
MAEELDNLPLKEIQKMAEMMSKSATNLYGLLDNMLQWTKLNQGKIIYDPQRLDFNTVSHEAVAVLKKKAESSNIEINLPASEVITLQADQYMLKTILRNLVANSLKFTECGGRIDISATRANKHAVVTVFNTGTGINSESLKKLFDISSINSSHSDEEERATSLGLLVCKEFIEKHGGRIWVENIKGKGTEFKFTIPIANGLQQI